MSQEQVQKLGAMRDKTVIEHKQLNETNMQGQDLGTPTVGDVELLIQPINPPPVLPR